MIGVIGDIVKSGVVLFYSSSSAMKAEALLVRAQLDVRLIQTPRDLSSDCGIALCFNPDAAAAVKELLVKGGVTISGIHLIELR